MEETGTTMENMLKPLTPFKLETDSNTVHTVCLSMSIPEGMFTRKSITRYRPHYLKMN